MEAKTVVFGHRGSHWGGVKHQLSVKAFLKDISTGFHFRKFIQNKLYYNKSEEGNKQKNALI